MPALKTPTLPKEEKDGSVLARLLVEKYNLTQDRENLANTAMLALIAQANLSGQANQKDYAERLSGFFTEYQSLVKELRELANQNM